MENKDDIQVSIFMLTYNQEEYIAQAIEGVLMQETFFSYQLVIGEDCSTDSTREICQEYAAAHPEKIKLLLNEKNIGLGANYVKTYAECTGKYVAICDGDDYWTDPLKLQKQVDFLESYADYNLVFTNNESLYPSGEQHSRDISKVPKNSSFRELVFGNYIASVTVLFRKKKLNISLENLIKNLPYGDWPTYLWVTKDGGKIHLLEEVTAVYRKNFGTSTALRKTKSRLGEINLSILEHLKNFHEFEPRLPEMQRAAIKLKTGLMASYNKENRFFKSLKMLMQLSLRQNFLYTGRVYLYSIKRRLKQI